MCYEHSTLATYAQQSVNVLGTHARANGRIGGGRYKLSATQQTEAIRMIVEDGKSQGQVAELFNVDRSTVSRMMTEVRAKEAVR
jgi:hypothetical protein